ncbi:MAG: hypothetical protein CMH52_01970 [Myxococcales bacterium]|nr:hypothetical protein [Myxococcales bacterium]
MSGAGYSHFLTQYDFGPFRCPRPVEHSVELTFVSADDHRLLLGSFTYCRHDLSFSAHERRAYAWVSGDISGFLACLELALFVGVSQLGGILMHASVGVIDGQAWLMPGPSGTGKSTAINGGFDRVLSDERVVLVKDKNDYRVWGTPFWSDGRRLPLDASSCELAGIVKLVQSPTLARCDLGTVDMIEWVMRSVIMYGASEVDTDRLMTFVVQLVDSTERIQVSFPKEGLWASSMLSQIGLAS